MDDYLNEMSKDLAELYAHIAELEIELEKERERRLRAEDTVDFYEDESNWIDKDGEGKWYTEIRLRDVTFEHWTKGSNYGGKRARQNRKERLISNKEN